MELRFDDGPGLPWSCRSARSFSLKTDDGAVSAEAELVAAEPDVEVEGVLEISLEADFFSDIAIECNALGEEGPSMSSLWRSVPSPDMSLPPLGTTVPDVSARISCTAVTAVSVSPSAMRLSRSCDVQAAGVTGELPDDDDEAAARDAIG